MIAGKLHHAAFVVRPRRYFVCRLLQLAGLHLGGAKRARGGDTWGRQMKKAHAGEVLRLSRDFMEDVPWWRWYLGEGAGQIGERITAVPSRWRPVVRRNRPGHLTEQWVPGSGLVVKAEPFLGTGT